MLKVYPAILHEEGGYWIEFPDLEGCQTYGETLEETMELAQEALGLYLVSLIENKQEIPAPSNIADLTADEGQLTYISTDIDKYRRDTRAVKKMLSIPALPLPLWCVLLNPVVFQIIGFILRATKLKIFIDAPSCCAASLGLAAYGALALISL